MAQEPQRTQTVTVVATKSLFRRASTNQPPAGVPTAGTAPAAVAGRLSETMVLGWPPTDALVSNP